MTTPVCGHDGKLYVNEATDASPVWVEIESATDVSVPFSAEEIDVSVRGTRFKLTKACMLDGSVEFGYRHCLGADADFDILKDAFINGTTLQFAFMDQDITNNGAKGWHFWATVTQMDQNADMGDSITYDFAAKPTLFKEGGVLIEPEWHVVPGT